MRATSRMPLRIAASAWGFLIAAPAVAAEEPVTATAIRARGRRFLRVMLLKTGPCAKGHAAVTKSGGSRTCAAGGSAAGAPSLQQQQRDQRLGVADLVNGCGQAPQR